MKTIPTTEAVGKIIAHDITEIVPGKFKGVAFKKGHVIGEEDIDHLLRIGKENIYILDIKENQLHEDDASIFLGEMMAGEGIYFTEPREGKINIKAKYQGLLKIDRNLLEEVNDLGDISIATIQGDRVVNKDELIGGCRVIPLIIDKEKLHSAKEILEKRPPLISVKTFTRLKTAVIVTGGEVYKGLIEDKFGPVVEKKLKTFNSDIIIKKIVPDDLDTIKTTILKAKEAGAQLIIVTGGMSVDPDDKTPGAIKATAAEVISYGSPVLPGSMLMVAYLDEIPIFGLPGCVMFSHTTAFDILLPKIFAGERIVRRDISRLGYGGLCLKCDDCTYPNCHFGKY
ncbi:molybdopterin-binding protein [Alkaliphilus serpentinus]|uniref:Molybdopterin molybdenumtransferase n=1 Tax=Alkaliphilus serpentinus TaxID=1482731 RepID=A0A833HNZ9_9FIRM|nr:molybdopterin-binding protein [Alkaliphilus serpentinus]KAB3530246.1 molybdopterin-binding protein [Alkaliphilus serpentinus]